MIRLDALNKSYTVGGRPLHVLRDLNLHIAPGELVAIMGASGSGKSTFMHLLGLLDHPSQGRIVLDGRDVGAAAATERDQIRNQKIGFVFQAHNLLPEQTALGNTMMPVRLAGAPVDVAHTRAKALLTAVGLGHRLNHKPGELSGGEQQRVAIARALVMGPGLVLADEPTGNLDPGTADGVFELFLNLNDQLGTTLIVVTHSHELAKRFPRRLFLQEGQFIEERD